MMRNFDPESYGPAFRSLLIIDRRRPLDAGQPDRSMRRALEKLTIEDAFAEAEVVVRDMASCCLAGVWLLHDFLDESHKISQSIDTPSGSYWHAIMHRREGDFGNSKYWYRRVGRHPVIAAVTAHLGDVFDPFTFVDRCEAAVGHQRHDNDACLAIQQVEWESLFDYCYRLAVGQTVN